MEQRATCHRVQCAVRGLFTVESKMQKRIIRISLTVATYSQASNAVCIVEYNYQGYSLFLLSLMDG